MQNPYKVLYYENRVVFKGIVVYIVLHYLSRGIAEPYAYLIASKYTSIGTMLFLTGAGTIVGIAMLYLLVTGKDSLLDSEA